MSASRALRKAVLSLPALSMLAAGCQILVPAEPANIRCQEEGAVGPPTCPHGEFCFDGECRVGPPVLGEPCEQDDLCGPEDHCFDPASVGLSGQSICSRPCCSSSDCGTGSGLICAILGPGKMCIPARLWGRADLGVGLAGAPCEADADCRSGLCSVEDHLCVDACCSGAECALFSGICRDRGQGWMCEPSDPGSASFPAFCEQATDCASGLCVVFSDGVQRCADPCCSSTECGGLLVGDAYKPIRCVPIEHGSAVIHACAAFAEGDANLAVGEPCTAPGQCRGGLCVEMDFDGTGPSKRCSDVCCTDASCGAPHLFSCVPSGDGGSALEGEPPGQGFGLQCVLR